MRANCCLLGLIGLLSIIAPCQTPSGVSRAGSSPGTKVQTPKRDLKLEQVSGGTVERDLIRSTGERVALVIGNSRYQGVPELRNPLNDAKDMAELLKQYAFAVKLETDLDLRKLRAAIDGFARGLSTGSVAVFFFAGHGVQVGSENYLIPTDFRMSEEVAVKSSAVAASVVQDAMEAANAGINILIFDACRNNPYRVRTKQRGLLPMDTRLGTLIAFATGPGQTADENTGGRNGLYTKHLLEALRMPLDVVGAFRRVRQDVHEASSGRQSPWFHEDILQTVHLNPSAGGDAPSTTGADLRDAQKLYLRKEYVEASKAFSMAVRSSPNDPYAHNALGVSYMAQGLFREALDRFNRAIQLKPDYRAAYYNRGLVHLRNPGYEAAEDDFSWALDENPEDAVLYKLRARARLGSRKFEEAMADIDRSLNLNPSDPDSYLIRASLHNRARRFADAAKDSEAALTLRPGDCEALRAREFARRAAGNTTSAAEDAALIARQCSAR